MPRRTQLFIKAPWTGGLNSSVDPGALPDNDLILADNIIFASSGSRLKRDGYEQFDSAANPPAIVSRSSSTTTRTITFASEIRSTGPTNDRLVPGESITITGAAGAETTSYAGTFKIDTVSGSTITYTAGGSLSEGTTATSTMALVRSSKYIDVRDFWYTDNSGVKQQLFMAFSSQGFLFSFSASGKRTWIPPKPEQFQISGITADVADSLNGDWFKIYDQSGSVGVYIKTSGGVDTPPGGTARNIQVAVATGASAATVATAIKTTLDGDAQFVASIDASYVVTVTDANSGTRTDVADQSTGWTFAMITQGRSTTEPHGATALNEASSLIYANRFLLAMEGTGNRPIYYDPNTDPNYYYDVRNAPDATRLTEYVGRVWSDDKLDRDLLHYSTTGDFEEWLGIGDSGALVVNPGDGDPRGLVALFPSFKGRLFIGKQSRLSQITGYSPEDFQIVPVSQGIGAASHKSVAAIDLDDMIYVSQKGVHSLSTTSSYGDFSGQFLSAKIQPTISACDRLTFRDISSAYISDLNSVFFNITEEGQDNPSALYAYNIITKEWYRWPDIEATALGQSQDLVGKVRLVWGTVGCKIYRAQTGDYVDAGNVAIRYRIKTGQIYPDGNPQTMKHFKKVSFLFKPKGRYNFTARFKIDNLINQSVTFEESVQGDALGTEFILGQSVLGTDDVFSPATASVDGFGRSIQIEIENNNLDEQVELYGYSIEYELADMNDEAI